MLLLSAQSVAEIWNPIQSQRCILCTKMDDTVSSFNILSGRVHAAANHTDSALMQDPTIGLPDVQRIPPG